MKYQTIQKVADSMGIDTSLIQSLIKKGELNKYKLKNRKRVFIDTEELEALIVPATEVEINVGLEISLDIFEV